MAMRGLKHVSSGSMRQLRMRRGAAVTATPIFFERSCDDRGVTVRWDMFFTTNETVDRIPCTKPSLVFFLKKKRSTFP